MTKSKAQKAADKVIKANKEEAKKVKKAAKEEAKEAKARRRRSPPGTAQCLCTSGCLLTGSVREGQYDALVAVAEKLKDKGGRVNWNGLPTAVEEDRSLAPFLLVCKRVLSNKLSALREKAAGWGSMSRGKLRKPAAPSLEAVGIELPVDDDDVWA